MTLGQSYVVTFLTSVTRSLGSGRIAGYVHCAGKIKLAMGAGKRHLE